MNAGFGLLSRETHAASTHAPSVLARWYQVSPTTLHGDHCDCRVLLGFGTLVVGGQALEVLGDRAVTLVELEGVRQCHARELNVSLVHALLGAHLVVDLLDVDRRDVVGQQHELVREDVVLILVFQGLRRDDPQLQQASPRRAR